LKIDPGDISAGVITSISADSISRKKVYAILRWWIQDHHQRWESNTILLFSS
jgi:hypothetical protein